MSNLTSITFKRTVNTGSFENFAVEATMAMNAADTAQAKEHAEQLQAFVDTLCQERVDRGKRGKRGGMDAGELIDDLP